MRFHLSKTSTRKVLVVDDFELARHMVLRALEGLGYVGVIEAKNGAEAEKILREAAGAGKPFHLVFTDIHMPEVDGLELLRRSVGDPLAFGSPSFVMVTAEIEQHFITEAIKLGALDYVRKPVNVGYLKRKIEAVEKKAFTAAA